MICDKHIFAHKGQYRTLGATDGLSAAEIGELEQFQFGQTNDAEYLQSLAANPAILHRRLSSGRFALTRIRKGPNDGAGRSTLAFITLVFQSQDWIASASRNLLDIISREGTAWDGTVEKVDLDLPATLVLGEGYSVSVADAMSSALVESMQQGHSLFGHAAEIDLKVIAHLVATASDTTLSTLCFAYRSLSDSLRVDLNILDAQYGRSGNAPPSTWFRQSSKVAADASSPSLRSKPRVTARQGNDPSTLDIRTTAARRTVMAHDNPRGDRTWILSSVFIFVLAAAVITAFRMGARSTSATSGSVENASQAKDLSNRIQDLSNSVGLIRQDVDRLVKNASKELAAAIKNMPEANAPLDIRLDNIDTEISNLAKAILEQKKEIGGLHDAAQTSAKSFADVSSKITAALQAIEGIRGEIKAIHDKLQPTPNAAPNPQK